MNKTNLHNEDASPVGERLELERPPHAPDWILFVVEDDLLVGHQTVEVDRGRQLGLVLREVVERVDLEYLGDEVVNGLDIDVQDDRISHGEIGRVGRSKVDLDSLLQFPDPECEQ